MFPEKFVFETLLERVCLSGFCVNLDQVRIFYDAVYKTRFLGKSELIKFWIQFCEILKK